MKDTYWYKLLGRGSSTMYFTHKLAVCFINVALEEFLVKSACIVAVRFLQTKTKSIVNSYADTHAFSCYFIYFLHFVPHK